MIDVKTGVRTAFFQALNGALSFNGVPVPIGDELAPPDTSVSLYVLLATQGGSQQNVFSAFASWETIDLDIVSKATGRTSKAPIDAIAGQILAILFPTPQTCSLPQQAGMNMLCAVLQGDRTIPLSLNASNSVTRRVMTFRLHVSQT